MISCPDDNALAQLADGRLDDAERARLEAHFDDCAACSQILSELGGMVLALRAPRGYRVLAETEGGGWFGLTADGRKVWIYRPAASVDLARAMRDARSLLDAPATGHGAVVEVVEGEDPALVVEVPNGSPILQWGAPPRDRSEVKAMWRAALTALASLHQRGVIHQGLSPERIRVHEGKVELVGLAAPVAEPAYQAPELRRGEPPSVRTDQFAICTAMWEGCIGRRPYAGATPGALAVTMQAPLALPVEDRPWFAALRRGLHPNPQQRWPDLAALLLALQHSDERPTSRDHTVRTLVVATLIAIAIGVGWWWMR